MINVSSARSLRWVGIAVLSLVALGALLLALLNPTAAGVAAILGILLLTLGVIDQSTRRDRSRAVSARSRIASMPRSVMPQRAVFTPAGDPRSALVVPGPRTDGYQLVLTVDGYQLVDEAGQPVYAFKQP